MQDIDMPAMPVHQWLGTSLAVVFVALAWWRWRYHRDESVPGGAYLIVAALVVWALVYQGHLGGGMTFGTAQPSRAMEGAPPPANGAEGSQPDGHPHGHDSSDGAATHSSSRPTGADGWSDYIEVR